MKKRINRIANRIALAIVIAGLAVASPLPRLNAKSSASGQTANKSSDAPSPLQGEDAIRSLKEQGLYDSLQDAVAATRYQVRWEDRPAKGSLPPAYHAPNPAQRYDAYFTPNGLNLAPRKAAPDDGAFGETAQAQETPEWRIAMRLIGHGYGENLLTAGVAALEARGNRIEYRRAWPPVTEWYVNKAGGLEQGFTIDAPPGIRSEGERLRLALELTGDLSAELVEGGQAVELKQSNGEIALSYSDLYAYDAQGRELPSRMKLSKGRVILEVDDENAVYPVTIDPTFTKRAILTASGITPGDLFGWSVATFDNTAVVGAPCDDDLFTNQGSAYVFVRNGETWSFLQRLNASDPMEGDLFGYSVAIYWNYIVVGAPYDDIGANIDQGSAYVFARGGNTWSQDEKLIAKDGAAGDRFGFSAALYLVTAVVGAPYDDISYKTDQGSAYTFVVEYGTWIPRQKLTADNGEANDRFGYSVAMDSYLTDGIVVGAPFDDVGTNGDQGSAYIFEPSGGSWMQKQNLTAGDGYPGDRFGHSVAMNSFVLAVGAPFDDDDYTAYINQGSVYVFRLNIITPNITNWGFAQKLIPRNGAPGDLFGYSVACSVWQVVVGAPYSGSADQGSAYRFEGTFQNGINNWFEQQVLTASSRAAYGLFGYSVANYWDNYSNRFTDTVIVGAPHDGGADQGSAYAFRK
jgi:hypothetical protein